jgi:putative transposase
MEQLRTFFITTVTYQRQALFLRDLFSELILESLFRYRDKGVFLLHEFVIMPDHLHLILTPSRLFSLEKAVQRIKGSFSFQVGKINAKTEVWQRSFTQHLILNGKDLVRHRAYILDNPVRARLVRDRKDYPLSSFHRYFRMDELPDFFRG